MMGGIRSQTELTAVVAIETLCRECFETARSKGWWDDLLNIPEKIALMHSELSEALEDYREGRMGTRLRYDSTVSPVIEEKPEGFWTELADVLIRIFDFAGHHDGGEALADALVLKMRFNATRPYRHGGKKA